MKQKSAGNWYSSQSACALRSKFFTIWKVCSSFMGSYSLLALTIEAPGQPGLPRSASKQSAVILPDMICESE